MKKLILVIAFLLSSSTAQLFGTTITYDFKSGLGSNFSTFNSSGLYNVDTNNQNLRISKSADDGSINPNGFITAGIQSNFAVDGDFTVTVDFTLDDFPAAGTNQLNESLLGIFLTNSSGFFEVLRFRLDSRNFVEAFSGVPLGVSASNIINGRSTKKELKEKILVSTLYIAHWNAP